MVGLTWRDDDGGYAAADYRIRPLRDHGRYNWRLEALFPDRNSGLGDSTISYHGTLRSARYSARSMEFERIRRRKTQLRLLVGVVALLTGAALAQSVLEPITFFAAAALFGLSLHAFATAAAIHFEHFSDWSDDQRHRLTLLDRMAAPLIPSAFNRRRVAEPVVEQSLVRVLPPQLPGR